LRQTLIVVVSATAAATTAIKIAATSAATATTTSATATTAATIAASVATTATVAASVATTATAEATSAGWALLFRLGKVNLDRAAIQLAAIQGVHGVLCAIFGSHLDKAKAFAAAAHAVHHHFGTLHFTSTLKVGAQAIIICAVGQVTYIQSRSSHISPD
jgi:hypothetical protein